VIPVIHTLFDGRALARHISGEFDIGVIEDCRLWRSFINDVYLLEAGGRSWWLRVHPTRWRSPQETEAEIVALLTITTSGGSVARPVARRGGGYLIEIEAPEGPRVAVLFEDAPGSVLTYFGPDGPANARRYGGAVARLHKACDGIETFSTKSPIDLDFAVILPSASLSKHLGASDQIDLARITARLTGTLQAHTELTLGFCHGDLNSSNIHFENEAAVAIDFDCCAWGWRAFELAAFARGVTWHSKPGETADTLIQAYFDGYRTHRPIAEADLEAQPAMLLAQRIWVTALHLDGADRWGSNNFGLPYAARFMDWLRAWEPMLDNASV
jgi:Ser/Thr protein kinase RdoA (MazF antagonist)